MDRIVNLKVDEHRMVILWDPAKMTGLCKDSRVILARLP